MQLLQRLTLDAVAQVRRTCLICDEDWCESCFADSAKQDAIKVRRCGVALVFCWNRWARDHCLCISRHTKAVVVPTARSE